MLLEDGTFLRVCFTGSRTWTEAGRSAFAVDRLEGVELRRLLRDHSLAELIDVLLRALSEHHLRRTAQARDTQTHLERLQALRVLLGR